MPFRRLKLLQQIVIGDQKFKWPDVLLVNSIAHYDQIIKIADPYSKTIYSHIRTDGKSLKEINDATDPLSIREIRKLRHHLTRRIWMLDGVFECINWRSLSNESIPKKSKLLPHLICYDCMLEGNKYIPKQLKSSEKGLCRCCGNENATLHLTRLGWPLDLRHKGFGFTVIGTGRNYTMNIEYYALHHDMSIYSGYKG